MFRREPAVIIGAIMSLIALLVGFGLKISGEQINLINTFLSALAPIIAGVVIRSQVSPRQDILTALEQPKGTSLEDLKEAIEKKNN